MKKYISLFLILILLLPVFAQAGSAHDLAYRQVKECAFGSEYGGERGFAAKWTDEIRVFFSGDYNDEDVSFFEGFIKQLNERVPGLPPVSIVNGARESNLVIHFVRLSEMPSVLCGYTEGNWGYFNYEWDLTGRIDWAEIGIARDVCWREARNHLLMEEFIGCLGLANDHWLDENSILYQSWTTVQKLTDADWNMLRMLYDSRVTPGMSEEDALRIMRNVY